MQEPNPATATATSAPPPPPPPSQHRRPRVREVSSRFMSPAVQRRPRSDSDSADENSETPFPMASSFSQRKQQQQQQHQHQHQHQHQRSAKLLRENNGHDHLQQPHPSKSCSGRIGNPNAGGTPCVSRPGTPTPSVYVSSRYRLTQPHHNNHHHHRFVNSMASAAEKLMQASGLNQAKSSTACSSDDSGVNCSVRSLPELGDRDRDMLLHSNVSDKIGSGNGGELKLRHPSPLSRSVSLPSPGGDLAAKGGSENKPPCSVSKQHGSGNQLVKSGGLSLPPVAPQCVRPGVDARKGKRGSSHQEDVHSLRLLHNRYLQWRFANAKAQAAMKAQEKESLKALYSQSMKISEMRDSVNTKHIELQLLRRSKTLSTILEAQIPYLDEWSTMIEEYSVSISEVIQALVNASVQLPTGGNVRVDVRELGEALDSAFKIMETMISNIRSFMPKAEETDTSISELARVAVGEKALIGECGDLLSKTYKLQLEECSSRGHLIQLHSICHKNKNEEQQTS
ncbi:protein ENDOSPERM DEFECTIVE 1 [Cajanus cajan]|uniref:protein ENDOSPERM DEFECTIVE 1 n=1 Tax=Cajanus cajan TaxID=3821 RepID=UPI00098DA9D5|nr:protein ENDOSPERM DEFECTIVE 1 [Cajanus cajan]